MAILFAVGHAKKKKDHPRDRVEKLHSQMTTLAKKGRVALSREIEGENPLSSRYGVDPFVRETFLKGRLIYRELG